MKTCRDCPAVLTQKHANYCDDCRWRHRGKPTRWTFDPTKDAYLRAHYMPTERNCAVRIAALWGYPVWAVRGRCARLGLTREGYPGGHRAWTPKETAVVEQYAAKRTPKWIARKLGRSVTAIVVKIKRLGLSQRPDGYTEMQVAQGFGVERGTVERWRKIGWLRVAASKTPGQAFAITDDELRAFIGAHRDAFDLRKVDQHWFLDLLMPMKLEQSKGLAA